MKRTRGTYRLIEFIRPCCYWPQPYCVEQALGVYRWMVETALDPKYQTRWGCNPTLAQLAATSGRVRDLFYFPSIGSIAALRKRFQYALFSAYGGDQWREDYQIHQDAVRTLTFPHYRLTEAATSEHEFTKRLEALWATTPPKGQKFALLTTQLNSCHADAVECYGAPSYLRLRNAAQYGRPAKLYWEFVLHYGCDGSVWNKSLATQKPGEAFRDLFERAEAKYKQLTVHVEIAE